MIRVGAYTLLPVIYSLAEADATDTETGWAQLGPVRCSYYPVSNTSRWWLPKTATTKAEAERQLDRWLVEHE